MNFKGKSAFVLLNLWKFTESGAVTQCVIKGQKGVVYGATSTCKNRGSMDPVHILMDPVHKGGPWTSSKNMNESYLEEIRLVTFKCIMPPTISSSLVQFSFVMR